MEQGSKYKDFTGAVDKILSKCFNDMEKERLEHSSGLSVGEQFELNARTALFALKQQANSDKSLVLQALVPLVERRMQKMFDGHHEALLVLRK